ncbi:hypothetical protein RR48_01877 [Papilio machaon]|uniref:Ionotropic receptor 75a N-terminal domain-containing protein n=1 Tax=Papilio machaon TaxID=76193 RepID=A0A0N1I7J4_PAPMA|nr:hypothetical protein RR48_01877 [Papilio machaon]
MPATPNTNMEIQMLPLLYLLVKLEVVVTSPSLIADLSLAYFQSRDVRHLCYLSCNTYAVTAHYVVETKNIVGNFIDQGIRTSVIMIDEETKRLEPAITQSNIPLGIYLDASCTKAKSLLTKASRNNLFDALHIWLIINYAENKTDERELDARHFFLKLNLSVNTDIVLADFRGDYYELIDIFNYGKIQGNGLEWRHYGTWSPKYGINTFSNNYKYKDRWNFHNLTLRAVSVILERPKVFRPAMLTERGYTPGVSAMTKVVAQLLHVLIQQHNFRFNYTIVGRWIGSTERNSTLAVTNSLFWGEQDISCTCARIFPKWLNWVDVFFPATTTLETKFYYLIPDKGVGDYENRFLTPMSPGVWWCACAAGALCVAVLAAAACLETRPEPHVYAFFSVFATTCQQEYEDGVQILQESFSSQGRRLILLVVGLTSMLLYNYYTSSVVSWLLNAAAPTLHDLDTLMNSDLELIFEDIGYTRGWLDNPGFFYYSGYKNPKEDELRNKKVINAKRTVPLLQPVNTGIELVRTGAYAYHTEPYTAYQTISKTFDDTELCKLGSLQMMQPAQVYIMAQKRSPYKEFFVWSLIRLQERGHVRAAQGRVSGPTPACSGSTPRALALGQAAPAFAVLAEATLLSVLILIIEILWHSNSSPAPSYSQLVLVCKLRYLRPAYARITMYWGPAA